MRHRYIKEVFGHFRDNEGICGDTDKRYIRAQLGQKPIIIAASITKPCTHFIKTQPRNER